MVGKINKKGFEYKTCNFCNGKKYVLEELVEDYILSLNEESIEYYE